LPLDEYADRPLRILSGSLGAISTRLSADPHPDPLLTFAVFEKPSDFVVRLHEILRALAFRISPPFCRN